VSTDSELTLRPSWRKYGRSILRPLSLFVLAGGAFQFWLAGFSGGKHSGEIFGFLAIALILLVGAADLVYRMTTVIRITREQLEIEAVGFMRRAWPRASVAGVVFLGSVSYMGTRLYAVIYDRHHRCLAALPEGIWDEDDLHRLQTVLATDGRSAKHLSSGELGSEFPGALRLERYVGWGLAVVVIGLIFVAAAMNQ
jgi:hypothetical protein